MVINPVCKTLSQYPGCEKLDYWVKRVTIVLYIGLTLLYQLLLSHHITKGIYQETLGFIYSLNADTVEKYLHSLGNVLCINYYCIHGFICLYSNALTIISEI